MRAEKHSFSELLRVFSAKRDRRIAWVLPAQNKDAMLAAINSAFP